MTDDRPTNPTTRLPAAEVARRSFGTSRRGFDPDEVRSFLELVSKELVATERREQELLHDLSAAEERARHPVIDEGVLTSAFGERSAAVLRSAHEEAARIALQAEEAAAATLRDAQQHAAETDVRAESVAAERIAEAELVANALLQQAREGAEAVLDAARTEAESIVERARDHGRAMLEQATEARRRVLADMGYRRRVIADQIEQFRAARDEIAGSIVGVRHSVDRIVADLGRADDAARAAAADAARHQGMPVPESILVDEAERAAAEIGVETGSTLPPTGSPEPAAVHQSTGLVENGLPQPWGTGNQTGLSGTGAIGAGEPVLEREDVGGEDGVGEAGRDVGVGEVGGDGGRDVGEVGGEHGVGDVGEVDRDVGEVGVASGSPVVEGPPAATAIASVPTAGTNVTAGAVHAGPRAGAHREPRSSRRRLLRFDDVASVVEPPTDEPSGLTDRPGDVEDLFARLRAQRQVPDPDAETTRSDTGAGTALGAEPSRRARSVTLVEGAGGREGASVEAETVEATDVAVRPEVDDDGPDLGDEGPDLPVERAALARRTAVLDPVVTNLARRLKRALQDDQNRLLDRLRQGTGEWTGNLLSDEDAQRALYVKASSAAIRESVAAGISYGRSYGSGRQGRAPTPDQATVDSVAGELAGTIVTLLRRRLEGADMPDAAERIGAAYREWRGERIERLAEDRVIDAWGAGVLVGSARAGGVRWTRAEPGPGCADCEDNVLAGRLAPGDEFPTGHRRPPAHPGCRCVLLPTPS